MATANRLVVCRHTVLWGFLPLPWEFTGYILCPLIVRAMSATVVMVIEG